MWLIVGLGNPGRKYERNRHNIGFRVVDELARRHNAGSFRDKLGGQIVSTLFDLDRVLLQKPMEYMNKSGFAVGRAIGYYDVDIDNVVVVHDDIDLDLGRTKLKDGGGHGGHNGLRSLIEQLGSRDFLRIRCGIGRPGPQGENAAKLAADDRRVTSYVLGDFPSAQQSTVETLVDRAADAAKSIVARGLVASMNQFNNRGSTTEE